MCGRYVLTVPGQLSERYDTFNDLNGKEYQSLYNVAPGFNMPVITRHSPNQIEIMKWGLIPHWAKDPKIGYKMINARADSITTKPSFKRSFKNMRCLVPATGFYEWKKAAKEKMPYYIKLKNGEIFSFAGLYDEWKDAEGNILKTFTIITVEPDKTVGEIHNRMPAILEKEDETMWLESEAEEELLTSLLKPFPDEKLVAYPVSTEVNSPRNNSSDLIKPVE